MTGDAERAAEHAARRTAVQAARQALANARDRGAGVTELRLLTDRLARATERLRAWVDRQRRA